MSIDLTNLPWNFIYLTNDEQTALLTNNDGTAVLYGDVRHFNPPDSYDGSGGNRLLCTSKITGFNGPSRAGAVTDSRGRKIHWDE